MPCPAARRLLLPLLVVLPVLTILIGLGTWQMERLAWKTGILARIAAVEAGPAAPLAAAPETFAKVMIEGRFDHGREALLGLEVHGTTLGARLVTPLLRDGQAIGVLGVFRWTLRPFSDHEIASLESFADQAVIAIENARLFQSLEQRTAELSQALEQQIVASGGPELALELEREGYDKYGKAA